MASARTQGHHHGLGERYRPRNEGDPLPSPTTSLSTFIAGLPDGLESHPACQVKGTVVRSFLLGSVRGAALQAAALPHPVAELVQAPPLNSVWVSEVHFFGALLAVRDLMGGPAWRQWCEERCLQALTNPVLRLVMNFTSAEMLLSLSHAYWSMTHRGSKLVTVERSSHAATAAFEHAHGLVTPDVGEFLAIALAVPLTLSRAKSPCVIVSSYAPTRTMFKATWR
jgi:hypothetical protein